MKEKIDDVGECDRRRHSVGITRVVSTGSRTAGNNRAGDVCSSSSTTQHPPATAGEDLERELVSSRLLLIARICASRCNQIPAATRSKREGTSHASVCVFLLLCVCVCVCLNCIYLAAMFNKALLLGGRV